MMNSGVHDVIPATSSTSAGRRPVTGVGRRSSGWEESGPLASASFAAGRLRASQTGRGRIEVAADAFAGEIERAAPPFSAARIRGLQTGLFALAALSCFLM